MQESINSVDYICVSKWKLELVWSFLLDKMFSLFAEFDIGVVQGVEMNYWLAIKDDWKRTKSLEHVFNFFTRVRASFKVVFLWNLSISNNTNLGKSWVRIQLFVKRIRLVLKCFFFVKCYRKLHCISSSNMTLICFFFRVSQKLVTILTSNITLNWFFFQSLSKASNK